MLIVYIAPPSVGEPEAGCFAGLLEKILDPEVSDIIHLILPSPNNELKHLQQKEGLGIESI